MGTSSRKLHQPRPMPVSTFEEAARDKNGIIVSHQLAGVDFGVIETDIAPWGVYNTLVIENTIPFSRITIRQCGLQSYGTQPTAYVQYFV